MRLSSTTAKYAFKLPLTSGYILYPRKQFHGSPGYASAQALGTLAPQVSTPSFKSAMTEQDDCLRLSWLQSVEKGSWSRNQPESTIPRTLTPAGASICETASTLTRTPVAPALLPARYNSVADNKRS